MFGLLSGMYLYAEPDEYVAGNGEWHYNLRLFKDLDRIRDPDEKKFTSYLRLWQRRREGIRWGLLPPSTDTAARSLLQLLLADDPESRPCARVALMHPYFTRYNYRLSRSLTVEAQINMPSHIDNLRRFQHLSSGQVRHRATVSRPH